jgi:Domain of unknown function (DUF5615)
MQIRFQADADLREVIIKALLRQEPTIDITSAHQANLVGLNDNQVLAVAADGGRVLVTHDRKTMPYHFAEFINERTSPGVIVVPQDLAVASAVEDLLLVWATSDASEWLNRICYLPL